MSIRNKAALLCLALFFSQAHAEGIGGGTGGTFGGIGQGVGSPDGVATSKLNLITLSATSIAQGATNGTTLGTAGLLGPHTGTAVWSITDATGTFTINSSTGVVTVLSNTQLTANNNITIQIGVSGVSPLPPTPATFVIHVNPTCTNSFDFSQACNSQYLGFM
jgi:hypothetical protein